MSNPTVPKLTHVMNLRALLTQTGGGVIGPQRGGPVRIMAPLTGGFLKGVAGSKAEGLDVEILPGGSDWILVDQTTKMTHLDVRTHGKSADGHGFFIHYTGVLAPDDISAKFRAWDADAVTSRGEDHHWWTNPTFETGDPNFQWLTTNLFVGRGHWWRGDDGSQAVEYEIFLVSN